MSSNPPNSPLNDSDDEGGDNERDIRIADLSEQHLDDLFNGNADAQHLIDQHPDLEPDLEKRLQFVEKLYFIAQSDQDSSLEESLASAAFDDLSTGIQADEFGATRSDSESNFKSFRLTVLANQKVVDVSCPNCGIHIHLIDSVDHGEITCNSCGSNIQYDTNVTRSVSRVVGKRLGRFDVISILGQGGFGSVYKALDPSLDRLVAIKVPRIGYFNSENQYARFLREARNAARLRHPNIVQVYEIIEEGSYPFIVSEYVEGLTLNDLIMNGRLDERESVILFIKVCAAIEHAHQHGVIHRDIKPSNILLDADQNPYVTDFGLAHDDRADVAMTIDGEILGTPAYMSPEQARGETRSIGKRSDVYSLGVTLFKMLCGELPFRGSRRMLMHKVLNDDPPPVRKLNDSVHRDLDVIVRKAMAKEPERRYESARAFAEDLNRWLDHKPILARPESRTTRFAKWCRRNPRVAVLGAAIMGLLIAGLVGSLIWAYQTDGLNRSLAASSRVNVERLQQLYLQKGGALLEANHGLEALPWFDELLKSETNPQKSVLQRIRIQQIVNHHPTLTNVWAIPGRVKKIRYSENGGRVLMVDERNTVFVFDTENREKLNELAHDDAVLNAEFSLAGDSVVVASGNRVIVWEIPNGRQLLSLDHDNAVVNAIFNSRDDRIVSASVDGKVVLWDSKSGELLSEFDANGRQPVALKFFEPTGNLILASTDPQSLETSLQVWEPEPARLLQTYTISGRVTDLTSDEKGSRLICGTSSGVVRVWDLGTKQGVGEPLKLKSPVNRVGFAGSRDEFFVVGRDGTIVRGFASTAIPFANGVQELMDIVDADVNSDATIIASACSDGLVRLSWLESGSVVCGTLPHGTFANSVAWHPGGRRLIAAGNDGTAKEWDMAGLAPIVPILAHDGRVANVRIARLGDRALTVSSDRTARLWNTSTGLPIGKVMQHEAGVIDCTFAGDDQFVVTVGSDNKARVWNGYTGEPVGEPRQHLESVYRVASQPGTGRFVTGTVGGNIFGWDIEKDGAVFSASTADTLFEIWFSPDGNRFVTASGNGNAWIWNADDGTSLAGPLKHENALYRCQFDSTGQRFAFSGDSNELSLWSMDDLTGPIQKLAHKSRLFSFDFNSDGTRILTTDSNGNATVWEQQDEKYVQLWEHEFGNYQMRHGEFTDDGEIVVVCGARNRGTEFAPGNGVVYLLDSATGDVLGPALSHARGAIRVRPHPKREFVISCSDDHTARIFRLKPFEDGMNSGDLLAVLSGKRLSQQMRIEMLPPELQRSRFESVLKSKPELVRINSEQVKAWNQYVDFVTNPTETEETKAD